MDPDLLESLLGVGEGVLGALVGGLIAFLTLRTQLRHEAKEKERDRKLTLRREVHLEAIEAIGTSQLFLGSFSREDFEVGRLLDQLQRIPGTLSKAQLVASEATFEALDRFGDFMFSSSIALLSLRMKVDRIKSDMVDEREQISRLQQRHTDIQSFLRGVPTHDPVHARGNSELLRIQNEISLASTRLQKLSQLNLEAVERLGREAFQATLQAQVEAGKVTVQMRRELELPLREEWYLSRLQDRIKRLQPKVDDVYTDVKQVFAEPPSEPANPAAQADT